MKKLTTINLAEHPYPEQVIDTFKGFTIEVCIRDNSMNAAFHLRYRSYLAIDAVAENEEQLLYDAYDFLPNARIFLVWFEGNPVATVRSCIYSDEYNWLPTECFHYFSKDLLTRMKPNTRFLESGRFAVAPDFQGRQSLFAQFLLFRAHGLNAGAHGCSHIMTAVRSSHRAFYLRFLGMESISEQPIYVDWFQSDVYLLANETNTCLQSILKRGMPNYDQEDMLRFANCAQIPIAAIQLAA